MNALFLGGNSVHNKEWVRELETALAPLFETTRVHEYAHWASAGSIDLDHELHALRHDIHDLGGYVIIAKSAGTLIAMKGIAERALHPSKCIFLGTPLGMAAQQGHALEQWLQTLSPPTLFIQNAHDPVASYKELEHFLRQHSPGHHYNTIELPGNSHDYTDFETLKQLTTDFI